MNQEIRNYSPNEKPEELPKGYIPCEYLGKEARVDFNGEAITCTALCPYGNRSSGSVTWDEETGFKETPVRYFCMTKGLVKQVDDQNPI